MSSVCFYVNADEAGTSAESENHLLQEVPENPEVQTLQEFWKKINDDIKNVNADDFKTQALPLARIKKIMKLDEEVKMISSEAPVLFAKAAEIFIHELTLRAWEYTQNNRRRTLQRNDIAMAISKSDQFDFLIDIVPRHEAKVNKPRDDPLGAPSTSAGHASPPPQPAPAQQQYVVQPCAQLLQQQTTASSSSSSSVSPHPVTLVQQVQMASGEVQQVPVQLSTQQLQMIRLQLQQNPNQSFIIQPTHQQPQIIQMSSQGQGQPHQLFLAQVSTSQEES